MTKTTDINFVSVKGIQNSLKRLKTFNYLKEKHVLQ